MSVNIRFPNITGKTDTERLIQLQSYLHQLVQQLNWALSTEYDTVKEQSTEAATSKPEECVTEAEFSELKALIIKSADIVNAYYEVINTRLQGVYTAQSDFGTFREETEQNFKQTATASEEQYRNLQETISELNNELIDVTANIKTGLLYTDSELGPVYGLEVGQRTVKDGVEVFNKYARFTSNRLSFYDSGSDTEVAYISDYKLYITNAEISGNLKTGGYTLETASGLAFRWTGKGGDS